MLFLYVIPKSITHDYRGFFAGIATQRYRSKGIIHTMSKFTDLVEIAYEEVDCVGREPHWRLETFDDELEEAHWPPG